MPRHLATGASRLTALLLGDRNAIVSRALLLGFAVVGSLAQSLHHVESIRAASSLRPEVAGQFREPMACQQAPTGDHYVFDRRGHTVFRVPPAGPAAPIVQIGPEQGRILGASAFQLASDGRFVVADAPRGRERVQIFEADGTRIGGFRLPGRADPRIRLGHLVLSGISTLQFTGQSIFMSQPDLGGLVSQFSFSGHPIRTFGLLRPTGHEDNRHVHLALNSGIPLVMPDGSFYFVFQAGVPLFRKYDARGNLVFERHIEGAELDPILAALPTSWPAPDTQGRRELPSIQPTVRAAAVDRDGNLWVALTAPVLYVYDGAGEKVRTVGLRAAGTLHPASLSFSNRNTLLVTPGCYEFEVW